MEAADRRSPARRSAREREQQRLPVSLNGDGAVRPPTSSSPSRRGTCSSRAGSQHVEGIIRSTSAGARGRTGKCRSVLRTHLLRLVSRPSSGSSDHRSCRDFKPHPPRLGRLAVTA